MKKRNALITTLFSIPFVLLADAKSDEQIMEKIVVTGTKTAKLLSNSPVSVDVIEGSTIKLLTKGTLVDALDFIPGVMVSRNEKDGYNIQMQGFDSKHVLVLVNGKAVISPTGSAADLGHISAHDITQIEVVKGAASVMYGSSAMGGVINIITNSEDESISATYELGSYLNNSSDNSDTRLVSQLVKLNAAKEVWDWHHSVNIQHMRDAGFDYDTETVKQDEGELDKTFFSLSSHKQLAHFHLDLGYQLLDERKDKIIGFFQGPTGVINSYYISDVLQHKVDVSVDNIVDFWKVNGQYTSHQEASGSVTQREANIQLAEAEVLRTFQFGDVAPQKAQESGSELLIGLVTNYESMAQINLTTNEKEIADEKRVNISTYGQYNWIKKDYQVLAGVRAQQDSDFGFESAVGISALINLGNNSTQLRFGFDQGYRVPDLKERYFRFDHSAIGYVILGNEDLQPEKADSYSVSLDHRQSILNDDADFSFTFSAHYSDTKDFITYVLDTDPNRAEELGFTDLTFGAFTYLNINQAELSGFDLSNELTFSNWLVQLNYSYLEAIDKDGNRVENKPRHQLKLNFGYDFEEQEINTLLYLVYQGDEAIPADYQDIEGNHHVRVNFKLNQNLSNNLSWHLALDNIFDEHKSLSAQSRNHYDPRPISSREIRLGATYQF